MKKRTNRNKRTKGMKEKGIQRFLRHHAKGCMVSLYGDPNRHCSCGRDEAELEFINLQQISILAEHLTRKITAQ